MSLPTTAPFRGRRATMLCSRRACASGALSSMSCTNSRASTSHCARARASLRSREPSSLG
eukprot:9764856-Lingulodinium_polyedra.AAC.1